MPQQEAIGLMEFQRRFSDEDTCYQYLFNIRWPNDFVCPRCWPERVLPGFNTMPHERVLSAEAEADEKLHWVHVLV